MEPADIGAKGERLIVAAFRAKGCNVEWNTAGPGATDIKVDGRERGERLLIQVKTAIAPNEPAEPTAEERAAIRARAKTLGYTALVAYVVLPPTEGTPSIRYENA